MGVEGSGKAVSVIASKKIKGIICTTSLLLLRRRRRLFYRQALRLRAAAFGPFLRGAAGEEIRDIVLVLGAVNGDDEGRRVVTDLADVLGHGVDVEIAVERLEKGL